MGTSLGWPLLWRLVRLHHRRHWTREQVRQHQERMLRRVRAYAYAHSPFYRKFHQGLSDRPLEELPVLTKALMLEHFDELVTDRRIRLADVRAHDADGPTRGRYLDRYRVLRTYGSSGLHAFFLQDRREMATLLASFFRATWGVVPRSHWREWPKIAMAGDPGGIGEQMAVALRGPRNPVLFVGTKEPRPAILERLNAWQPDVLSLAPFMLDGLLNEACAGNLQIAPRVVFCGAEVLTGALRRRVQDNWGAEIFDRYACTECGIIAAECSAHRGKHLFDDLAIVEIVDENDRPVPPGVYGKKVLLTTLFRRTQPLIRYEISDLVRLSAEPCSCGHSSPVIDDVQGRVWQVLPFPTRDGGTVAVPPLVLYQVMETVPAQWQVVQERDELRILLSAIREPIHEGRLAEEMRRALEGAGAVVPPVRVEHMEASPWNEYQKRPLICSYVTRQEVTG